GAELSLTARTCATMRPREVAPPAPASARTGGGRDRMSAVGELVEMPSRRKRGGAKEKHPDNKAGLAFMTPWLLGFLGITLLPLIASLGLAFTDYSLLAPPEVVGLDNIREVIAASRLPHSPAV